MYAVLQGYAFAPASSADVTGDYPAMIVAVQRAIDLAAAT
jgi:hypothetical protein